MDTNGTSNIHHGGDTPLKYRFTGHETFPFRYSWPLKGVRLVLEQGDLFSSENATVLLGVGKNMVTSIRHWSEVLGLIVKDEHGELGVTELGAALFGPEGWDPYMEMPATLWLLHWQLARNVESTSTWFLAFTRWTALEFRKEQLQDWLWSIRLDAPATRVTKNSLKRDVEVFLRTYTPAKITTKSPQEDTFDCPLVELGLISEIEKGVYAFARGVKPSLPDEIFIYSLLHYWNTTAAEQSSLSFEYILHGPGAPGGAFKLSENDLYDYLVRLPRWAHIRYDDTAGLRQVFRDGRTLTDPMDVLRRYYTVNNQ